MRLVAGQRLEGSAGSVYVVGAPDAQSPWQQFYPARKVFVNYRYDERQLYEAAEDEWIDVLLRLAPEPRAGEPLDMSQRRELLRYEATQVLSGDGTWFPEAVDWLETPAAEPAPSADAGSATTEPVLVVSRPHGVDLRAWRGGQTAAASLAVASEVLDMLALLHRRGQAIGALAPENFLLDESGRLTFLSTYRVLPEHRADQRRTYLPPESYPPRFTAPEALAADGVVDARSDLYAWGALSFFLITGQDPPPRTDAPAAGRGPLDEDHWERLEMSLAEAAGDRADRLAGLSPQRRPRLSEQSVAVWLDSLGRTLAVEPKRRPKSVAQLRGGSSLGRWLRSVRRRFSWKRRSR